jgi:MoxR-like ATPase
MQETFTVAEATSAIRRLIDNVERVIAGSRPAVESAAICLLAEGNLLLEGVPGVGKTMLGRALARSIGGTFRRVQSTPDLLPSDLTGISVFDQERHEFRFVPGPLFANVVLIDEINRATPRTQSALFEPMEERQVTVDGVTRELPAPFLLIATENPLAHYGTYPLPEGQLDRFAMAVTLDYPDRMGAREVVTRQMIRHPIIDLEPVLGVAEVVRHQQHVRRVHIETSVIDYAVALVEATRSHPDVALGASPRASLSITRCAQARAVARGRDFVLPDDVKALAPSVLAHRLLLKGRQTAEPEAARRVVEGILREVPVPLGAAERA